MYYLKSEGCVADPSGTMNGLSPPATQSAGDDCTSRELSKREGFHVMCMSAYDIEQKSVSTVSSIYERLLDLGLNAYNKQESS